jgi:predicted nucleic acid-binding Zn finger protein
MVFRPSGKKIWTVVGKDNEYWVDPETEFCSCNSFYFKTLSGGEPCYHIKAVKKSMQNGIGAIEFDDEEYLRILQAVAEDTEKFLLRR